MVHIWVESRSLRFEVRGVIHLWVGSESIFEVGGVMQMWVDLSFKVRDVDVGGVSLIFKVRNDTEV